MYEFQVLDSRQQFLSPFLLKEGKIESLVERLLMEDYLFFDLENDDYQDRFYGDTKLSHRAMENYFMPYIESILFPKSLKAFDRVRRFSKAVDQKCTLKSTNFEVDFIIDSMDIYIFPYHIGLVNLRVRLPGNLTNNEVYTFTEKFRNLVPRDEHNKEISIHCDEIIHDHAKDFIFNNLLKPFKRYMENHTPDFPTYYGSLPFYMDERMFVVSYMQCDPEHDISKTDLYRAGELNGYDQDGEEYIGATNNDYVDRYYKSYVYDRWASNTFYVATDSHFVCITKEQGNLGERKLRGMYGDYFYTLLLLWYYRLMLLKLNHEHSQIEIEKDHSKVNLLTIMISDFSAKYYFPELSSNISGREIANLIRNAFNIERLYSEVDATLSRLFKKQEKLEGNQINALLQILTIYTVISGIYGMNLVIDDLSGNINWSKFMEFSFFEWIVVFVTITGIVLSFIMGYYFLKRWMIERRSKKRKMY